MKIKTELIISFYGGIFPFLLNLLIYIDLIKIYLNVGFFIVDICIDCRRKRSEKLIKRYNNFLIAKITEKEEKCLRKLEKAYNKLNETEIQLFLKNTNEHFFGDIQAYLEKVEQRAEIYRINLDKKRENNADDIKIEEHKNEIGNYNVEIEQNQSLIQAETIGNITERQLAPYIRNLKKSMRKIIRFKYLREEIEKKINKELNKKCWYKILLIFLFCFYFLVSFIIIFIDIFLPIGLYSSEKETIERKEGEYEANSEEKQDLFYYLESLFFLIIITIVNSPYTIAVFYSINKREFISGECFYGKNMGDNYNLIETISSLTGFAYPLSYCNLYLYYIVFKYNENIGTAIFYQVVKVPDYLISGKFSILIIIKLFLIIVFIFLSHCFEIKNDLGGFNRYINNKFCKHDYLKNEDLPLAPIIS